MDPTHTQPCEPPILSPQWGGSCLASTCSLQCAQNVPHTQQVPPTPRASQQGHFLPVRDQESPWVSRTRFRKPLPPEAKETVALQLSLCETAFCGDQRFGVRVSV